MKTFLPWTWIGLMLFAGACATEQIPGECKRDSDCEQGFHCGDDYRCLCNDDQSCAAEEFCNPSGYCQKYTGCRTDADCGSPEENFECRIRQLGNGSCLCRTDAACQSDEVCSQGVCQKKIGCAADADCGPEDDWICRRSTGGAGECVCETDRACAEGEICNAFNYCQPAARCGVDADCPGGMSCDAGSGDCLCDFAEQTGCAEGQVCNSRGYCQPIPGCYTNDDCVVLNTFCDSETAKCIPDGFCRTSLQCPLEQYCDINLSKCINGCASNDDCPLDKYCLNHACASGCQDDSLCGFAEFCNANQCQSAYSEATPYCKACMGTGELSCGAANWCPIYNNGPDDFSASNSNYCAPDCSNNERCPNGFDCGDIIVISGTCGSDPKCNATSCTGGNPCIQSPEEQCGFCPCSASNPCPNNVCFFGKCLASAKPCTTTADCRTVECSFFEGESYGYCVIGRSCGLKEGYHCHVPPP